MSSLELLKKKKKKNKKKLINTQQFYQYMYGIHTRTAYKYS